MNAMLRKTRFIGALLLPCVAHADLATDIRPKLNIPAQYSDQVVNKVAFSTELYGLNYAYAILAYAGYDSFVVHIANGEYHLAANEIAGEVSRLVIEDFITTAVGFPVVGQLVLAAHELSLNALNYSLEVNAFRIQHNRYFQARPYNSFLTILNLEPFDLLDGVNMTKEGRGWLFTTSGYLTPYPSGNLLTPAQFYGLAESAWQSVNIDRAKLEAEGQLLRQGFSAQLAATLAEETVKVAPLSPVSAAVTWACAPGVTFHIEHSTNLATWTRTGPHTSIADSMQVVLTSLPPSPSRFFRIICQP
jgi:hypothetical protein